MLQRRGASFYCSPPRITAFDYADGTRASINRFVTATFSCTIKLCSWMEVKIWTKKNATKSTQPPTYQPHGLHKNSQLFCSLMSNGCKKATQSEKKWTDWKNLDYFYCKIEWFNLGDYVGVIEAALANIKCEYISYWHTNRISWERNFITIYRSHCLIVWVCFASKMCEWMLLCTYIS